MAKKDLKRETAESGRGGVVILDNGGTRSGRDRRQEYRSYTGDDRRSGKDRRRGYDRRTGTPRRRTQDRRNGNRLYWNGTAVERRDAFRGE